MLKCTIDFRWNFAQDRAAGDYSASPESRPLAVFKGPTYRGRRERERKGMGKER